MEDQPESPGPFSFLGQSLDRNVSAGLRLMEASQNYMAGLARYAGDFMVPYLISTGYFENVESRRLPATAPLDSAVSYLRLLDFNLDLLNRGVFAGLQSINAYGRSEMGGFIAALYNTFTNADGGDLAAFARRQADLMDLVVHAYPEAIQAIESEYGFHFERGEHRLVAETDRFFLYRIAPTDRRVQTRADGKPVLILPPYVLGANILGFLPGEQKSYAHCFADRGVPTYIRILKDIQTTEALQVMTGDDDALDTRLFCEAILEAHGRPVTLNGYCQGGFSAVCNLLSGKLDGLVDAFITCVAPMDGTRSKGLAAFLAEPAPTVQRSFLRDQDPAQRQFGGRRQAHGLGVQAQEHRARNPHLGVLPGPDDVRPPGADKGQDRKDRRGAQLLARQRAQRPASGHHPDEL